MSALVPVFFATTEGHTRKIAEYLAADLRARGVESVAIEIDSVDERELDWASVRGAIVGASIHIGKHQKAATEFVRRHRAQLNERPTALFSVSLSAGSSHPEEVEAARQLARRFVESTQWFADRVVCLAGCLAYTRYGFFKRLMLRRIARQEGASTDVTRDHEYTDWKRVDALADWMAATIKLGTHAVVA